MTAPLTTLLPTTARALHHRIAVAQAEGRAPSLTGAVGRDGELVWTGVRPFAQEGDEAGVHAQYRVGSITKTFTAVLVMRLRDEGLIDLQDPLEKHLPGTGIGEVTIAQLLAHSAGLGAETPSPWWERSSASLRPGLPEVLGEHPRKHAVGRRFHYSNPGYTVLGSLVEEVRGDSWAEVLQREVLEPLAMSRTSLEPQAPYAQGWAVHPWADVLLPEPPENLGLMAPAGQLWSTVADLCRFGAFLAEGDDRVLGAPSVREMRTPSVPAESEEWDATYGLGLQIIRRDGRTLVGHGGSLPGFVAGLWVGVDDGVTAAVLANATSGPLPSLIATDLIRIVADAEPRMPLPWRPLQEVDQELLELTGPWYWGTYAFGLQLLPDRALALQPLTGPGRRARFAAVEDGTWIGENGYYAGETLRVVRHEDGSIDHLDLASFVFTRTPYEPEAEIPGGVDKDGWRGLLG